MAIDEKHVTYQDPRLRKARRMGFGIGLMKGLAVTFKHLFKHNTVIEYPDEKQDLSPRTRGVIALKQENCTVCMLCGRECPDWCIYIDSHKEELPPKREGGRKRKRNVLDRFAIDYALCMFCGICVEVCPYDALFWSREFEYAEYDIRELTHEKERLSDWMATVLPPPPLEVGAEVAGAPVGPEAAGAERPAPQISSPAARAAARAQQAAAAPARAAAPAPAPVEAELKPAEGAPPEPRPRPETEAPPQEAPRPVPQITEDPEAVYAQVLKEQLEKGSSPEVAEARAKVARLKAQRGIARGPAAPPAPAGEAPAEQPSPAPPPAAPPAVPPAAPEGIEAPESPQAVYERVLAKQLELGSSPPVAEARAKVARVKAEREIARAAEQPPVPSGAPSAEAPQPEAGPAAPTPEEKAAGETPSPAAAPAPVGEDPEAIYERVLAEERAKGSSDAVAQARAKAARMRAIKGTGGPK